METSKNEFKSGLQRQFGAVIGGRQTPGLMDDLNKYTKEMKEGQKLKGGKSDNMSVLNLAQKHAYDDSTDSTSKDKIKKMIDFLKSQLEDGIKVEMEHTKDKAKAKEIAMDHLWEDPKYYKKLKKIETKEQLIRRVLKKGIADKLVGKDKISKPGGKIFSISKTNEISEDLPKSAKQQFAQDLQIDPDFKKFKEDAKYKVRGSEYSYGAPNVTTNDPYIKKRKYSRPGKEEASEATGSGSSGAYSGPLFGGENEFIKKSDRETPKLKEGLAMNAMGLGGVEKVEATEATTSGSVGGYETPAMWAKSTKKKDWGPSRKTQYPGGAFVKVKKKCTKFPYCNQGDINALKISKNESVKEAIKNVSTKYNISEEVIKTILEYEYSKIKR